MNIVIYCAALNNNPSFEKQTIELCSYLASLDSTLVYGGGKTGLMGIVGDTFLKYHKKVIGVVPNVDLIIPRIHQGVSELIKVETMAERRNKMIELGDIFIALPGGVGTLDELSEVADLLKLSVIDHKKLIIYNMDNFYQGLKTLMQQYVADGMLDAKLFNDKIIFIDNLEELKKIL